VLINFISSLPSQSLQRQEEPRNGISWVFSTYPLDADLYVVYGVISRLEFVNRSAPKVFVALEPPEIFRYSLQVLECYDVVLAAGYDYLGILKNVSVKTGLLNWSIHAAKNQLRAEIAAKGPVMEFHNLSFLNSGLTAIVSLKRITKLQKRRLKFVKYLSNHLPELQLYGREFNPVHDKREVLVRTRFHLAIENSIHPRYWTEKLSDSLLSGAKTFYVGDPQIASEFSNRAVVPLDIQDFEDALSRMKEVMNEGFSHEDNLALISAQNYILDHANIFSRILQLLDEGRLVSSGRDLVVINHQPIPLQNRIRFFKSQIPLRTFVSMK
jgi:hypothetical protein